MESGDLQAAPKKGLKHDSNIEQGLWKSLIEPMAGGAVMVLKGFSYAFVDVSTSIAKRKDENHTIRDLSWLLKVSSSEALSLTYP